MPAEAQTGANITLAANVLLYAYVVLAVLKQSDAELILPSSTFDLGGLLDKAKDGIPGGSFVAPLLQVQIPLTVFYTLGPLALLALHGFVVLDGRLLREAATPLRVLAVWLPSLTLALIRWRFAPYVSARPEPPLSGVVLEQLQVVALALDMVLVLFALRCARIEQGAEPLTRARSRAALARTLREAATVWLAILLGSFLVGSPQGWAGLALAVAGAGLVSIGPRSRRRTRKPPPDLRNKELPMLARLGVAFVFVVFAALPAVARSLDLSGESLVAQAPTETMMAALVASPGWRQQRDELVETGDARFAFGRRITVAREAAWLADGRGIDLHGWHFPGTRFDHATMAHIDLSGATLTKASFDYANLVGAQLRDADLGGSSFRYVDFVRVHGEHAGAVELVQSTATAAPGAAPVVPSKECAPSKLACSKRQDVADQNARDSTWNGDSTSAACASNGWSEKDRSDFSRVNLTSVDLTGADLTCAHLRGVTMSKDTRLIGTILTNADFCGAQLNDVDFGQAGDMSGVSFDYADLGDARLARKNLKDGSFFYANIRGAKFDATTADEPPIWAVTRLPGSGGSHIVQVSGVWRHLDKCLAPAAANAGDKPKGP